MLPNLVLADWLLELISKSSKAYLFEFPPSALKVKCITFVDSIYYYYDK